MTPEAVESLPWPGARRGRTAPADLPRGVVFALAVLVILVFSQGWVMPLTGPDGDPEASALIRAGYVPGYLAGATLAWSGRARLASLFRRAPLLWPPLLVIAASVLWSVDPDTTLRRAVALGFTVLGGLGLAGRLDAEQMVEAVAATFALLAAAALGLALARPDLGRMTTLFPGAWRGLWYEKNALGDFMTVGVVALLAAAVLRPRRRWLWTGFAAVALALVVLSTSKTSLVTLGAGLGVLALTLLARRGGAWTVAAAFAALLGVAAAAAAALFAGDRLLGLLGKDATLTGRTKVWAGALREAALRPWTGYGYGAVWSDADPWGPRAWIFHWAGFTPQHAHNSWIETYLGEGRIGVAAVAGLMLDVWTRAVAAAARAPLAVFALPFLAVYSLAMLTESVMLIYNDFETTLLVAVAASLALPPRAAAATP